MVLGRVLLVKHAYKPGAEIVSGMYVRGTVVTFDGVIVAVAGRAKDYLL